jgi:hypothetical protein
MKPRTRSRNAVAWLRTEPGFARLGEQAARLADLQADLARCVPGLALTVVALERDTLVVGAAHAAVAAKIRQSTPTVLAALARQGWKIERIRFKPQWRPGPARPPRRQKDAPGAAAVASIAALAERVEDPKLKEALRRLAARHGGAPNTLGAQTDGEGK